MNISILKNSLKDSQMPFFLVNKNNCIQWQNNSFKNLFNFLIHCNSTNKLSFKVLKREYFLKLIINKKIILYSCELLIKAKNNSIYKINDNHIEKIIVLKNGIECLKNGKIKFALQKQFKLQNLSISGYELLARMYLKNGSLISNEHFMPLIDSAFQLSILVPKAIKEISFLKKKIGNKIVWINISAELLEAKSFCNEFIKLTSNHNLNHKNIGIEITESHKIVSNANIIESLIKLKQNKFHIAMDDFGSGYANIKRLSILPVDIVKLDKSFVVDISNNKTKNLIKGIVKIGKDIGFSVLAEGIETKGSLILLKKLGVKYGQGWYIGKPKLL